MFPVLSNIYQGVCLVPTVNKPKHVYNLACIILSVWKHYTSDEAVVAVELVANGGA